MFDNFTVDDAKSVFNKLHDILKDNGLWFFTDFNIQGKSSWWKLLFIKFMYQFFTFFKIINTQNLVNIAPYFKEHNYTAIDSKLYYGTFIEGIVYQK